MEPDIFVLAVYVASALLATGSFGVVDAVKVGLQWGLGHMVGVVLLLGLFASLKWFLSEHIFSQVMVWAHVAVGSILALSGMWMLLRFVGMTEEISSDGGGMESIDPIIEDEARYDLADS